MICLKKIPARFKTIVDKAVNVISKYKDTKALFLIGSIADGSYNSSSDIDLVWIKSYKISYSSLTKLEKKINSDNKIRVQLVPFTSKQILWHFKHSSTMAHSIQKGIILYGKKNKFTQNLLKKKTLFAFFRMDEILVPTLA